MNLRVILRVLVAVLVLGSSAVTRAEDEAPSPWKFEIVPYAWLPGTFGTVEVLGRTARVDSTVYDTVKLLFDGDMLGGAIYLGASYDRWSLFVDGFGGFAKADADGSVCCTTFSAKVKMYEAIVDVGLGYQLGAWTLPERRRPLTLGVYAGTRIMYLSSRIQADVDRPGVVARSLDASRSWTWADPMIGVRWEVPVHDRISLDFRGDIGGFGASSKLIWGLVGGARWWLDWSPFGSTTWLGLGYRAVSFDHDFAGSNQANLELRGPYAALGFAF